MRFSARMLFFVLFLSGFLASIFSPSVRAQTISQNITLPTINGTNQLDIGALTQQVMTGFLSGTTCLVGGVDFTTKDFHCRSYNPQTGTYIENKQLGGGLLGLGATGIALTYNEPIHTSDYAKYLSSNFGLVKKADAASNGIGFNQLSPLTNLWLAFRNLSYLLFVIIFVVIGFSVMLRAKIDPRTVMTIENQIPKLIISLILITFSFAIAGLVIDFMWVGIYTIINVAASLDPSIKAQVGPLSIYAIGDPYSWVSRLATSSAGPVGFIGIAFQAAQGVGGIVSGVVSNMLNQVPWLTMIMMVTSIPGLILMISCTVLGIGNAATFGLLGTSMTTCVNNGLGNVEGAILGSLAFLIFSVALIVVIARVWWQLIKAYALFIVFVIFGPLIIMSGVIPGWTKTNFEYWLRHILAYTIVFPTVMGIFLLGKTLMDLYTTAPGSIAPPLLGVTPTAIAYMGPLLGFAVMMLAPQAAAMVQEALNAPDPKYLAQIGAGIAGGVQPITSLGMQAVRRSFRAPDYVSGLEEGWARKAMPSWLKNVVYGRPMPDRVGPGTPHGNTQSP